MKTRILFAVCLCFLLLSFSTGLQAAAPNFDFYKGKMVKILVTAGAGGGLDAYARMMAPYLGKYLGATVVVDNVTGAGGLVGRSKVYQGKPDGLTFCLTPGSGAILAEWAGLQGVAYKMENFRWIGKIYSEPTVMVVSAKSPFRSIEDIIKAGKLLAGTSGVGTPDYYTLYMLAKALGIDLKIITGFQGTMETIMAVVKNDVQCTSSSYSSARTLMENGDLFPVLVFSEKRFQALPQVPSVLELEKVSGDNRKGMEGLAKLLDLERVMFTTPGVPDDKLQAMRDAFTKTLHDPQFLADTVKNKRPVAYVSGEEAEKMFKSLNEVKPILLPYILEIAKKSQG